MFICCFAKFAAKLLVVDFHECKWHFTVLPGRPRGEIDMALLQKDEECSSKPVAEVVLWSGR